MLPTWAEWVPCLHFDLRALCTHRSQVQRTSSQLIELVHAHSIACLTSDFEDLLPMLLRLKKPVLAAVVAKLCSLIVCPALARPSASTRQMRLKRTTPSFPLGLLLRPCAFCTGCDLNKRCGSLLASAAACRPARKDRNA